MKLWRSLVFWGGLVVMGFIGWAWRDSTRNVEVLNWGNYTAMSAASGLTVSTQVSSGGDIFFEHRRLAGEFEKLKTVGMRSPHFFRNSGEAWDRMILGRAFGSKYEKGDPLMLLFLRTLFGKAGAWLFYVPYWLVLAMTAAVWAGGLWWRWRRIKRANTILMEEGAVA